MSEPTEKDRERARERIRGLWQGHPAPLGELDPIQRLAVEEQAQGAAAERARIVTELRGLDDSANRSADVVHWGASPRETWNRLADAIESGEL